MKDELGRKIMVKFVGLRVKTYNSLIDDSEDKKAKASKKCVKKLKFENYENCLRATEVENKLKYLEKKEISIDNLKKNHKEFIKKINIKNTAKI